ncbi:hypothetical protein SteCoe_16985 [Stentor coeruleus]|uniref:Arrestin-like N-terminal domain-containing protein n=1 Tax=Stentor coeruleus TaxID=5963 RepID=A0A1R2C001_9CILI|nr:hypothetical protein SteCoe_16985 [Stentor coeruleus]
MGTNSSNTASSGGMHIDLDKYVLTGGDTIEGTINIRLSLPLPPSNLYFQFKGKEETHWQITESSHPGAAIIEHDGSSTICKVQYEIMKWTESLQPGDYTIPFTFQTPVGIPGSFKFIDGKTRGEIQYFLSCKLINSHQKFKTKTKISILQDCTLIIPQINRGKKARLRSCCCSKGQLGLKIIWSTPRFKTTDKIDCLLEIDNTHSMLPVTKVSARLYYNLRLKDINKSSKFVTNTISTKVYTFILNPKEIMVKEDALPISLELTGLDRKFSMLYSSKGQIIECMFMIEVAAYVEYGCFGGGEIKVDSPFVVEPVVFFQPAPMIPPADWNPIMIEPANLIYEKKHEVDTDSEGISIRSKNEFNNTSVTVIQSQNTEPADNFIVVASERS